MAENDQILKRTMPNSPEAERSVIGCMIVDKESVNAATEMLTSEDFYNKQFGICFDAIKEVYDKTGSVDIVTLREKLIEKGASEEIANPGFLGDLVASVPDISHIKVYCEIVSEKAVKRNIIKVNEDIMNSCYTSAEESSALLESIEKKIFTLVQKRGSSEAKPIRDVVREAVDRIEKASKSTGPVTGIPTGFTDLDYKLSGLQNSDLILIAARPSMGKTALALNMAQYIAFKKNLPVAIFSLEMSDLQLVNRLFALESNINSNNIRTGRLTDDEWGKLIEATGTVGNSNLVIDATPGISISELRSRCRRYKMEKDIKIIFIDYLQLMSGNGGHSSESRQQEISEISRSLKALARELDVPVVALSQLSRAVEARSDKRPMLSDLRESGAIEQDADVVMFIYRDEYYNKEKTKEPGVAEVIVQKQRNGPIGTVKLAWLGDYTKFANLERRDFNNGER